MILHKKAAICQRYFTSNRRYSNKNSEKPSAGAAGPSMISGVSQESEAGAFFGNHTYDGTVPLPNKITGHNPGGKQDYSLFSGAYLLFSAASDGHMV